MRKLPLLHVKLYMEFTRILAPKGICHQQEKAHLTFYLGMPI
jgi:hypothetical protein